MRIGIFGGTFDPVHRGHVQLVKELKKKLTLNKVLVVPANVSPFKTEKPPKADGYQRLEMLKLAFESTGGTEVSDIELRRGDVSYTIDTIHEILEQYPHAVLYLLLTEEVFGHFSRWNAHELIGELATVVVATKAKKGGKNFIEIPWIDVSSTMIREKLLRGEDCSEFLSPKVVDFIHQNQLYSSA